MYLFSNFKKYQSQYFNFLIALIPFSFIAGNLLINLNVILVIFSSLLIFKKKIFELKFYFLDKIIISFFLLVLFSGLINDIEFFFDKLNWKGYFSTFIKSLFFLRYLILYLCLRFLIEKQIVNIKQFFLFSSIATLFVCLDIFFQSIYGQDIFGFNSSESGRKLGGPFGDELIAGGFIQRFFLFSFFLIPLFYKNQTRLLKYIIPVLFTIFLIGIILSGNRMPLIIFTFTIFLIVVFQKETRKYFFPFLLIFSIIFYLVFNFNSTVKDNFRSFYFQISDIAITLINKDFDKGSPQYLKEFSTFYGTWTINKYIGGGIKNFRYYCHHRPNINKNSDFICNMHPHNYYLEILTEVGIIGFTLIIIIFFKVLHLSFFKKYLMKTRLNDNKTIIPFIFLFIAEIFPIKSTGSFFTTGNTTYLFLILGILIALVRKNYSIENKT